MATAKNGAVGVPLGGQTIVAVTSVIEKVDIQPLNFGYADIPIQGTDPYMQLRFSKKARNTMLEKMAEGQQARGKRIRTARDYDADYVGAMYLDRDGRHGIPASSFRNAMIDVCRMTGVKMTMAKMSVFIKADALDAEDGTPLIWLNGVPERTDMAVRNATGVADIRIRPMWREWSAIVHLEWDADQFSHPSVANLLARAGQQVGIGEGRPFSKNSAGLGYGRFIIAGQEVRA